MTRLSSELQRLYRATPVPRPAATSVGACDDAPLELVDAQGRARALVVALRRPAGWEALSALWYGVQTALDLPAPGIAVSGHDALQLWFSLAEPIAAAEGQTLLHRLQRHFLPEVDARRIELLPAVDAAAPHGVRHAQAIPALQPDTGNWSAFLAPDLVPIFAETPWLDVAPNEEGQAALLRALEPITPDALAEALRRLSALAPPPGASAAPRDGGNDCAVQRVDRPQPGDGAWDGPTVPEVQTRAEQFLLQVMDDETVPLPLRIDAAKALLHDRGMRPPAT